tara:strand:- start:515 stop:826 length:312 start_codon:yes stop_codon:yes gene_type:complete
MNWLIIFFSGLITYFLRFSMISFIKKDMLSTKTKLVLSYVPSAVFPAIIFPAVLLEDTGLFVNYNDPKIIAILVAIIVGFFSKKIIATILSGLISYWIIIFLF